MGVEICLFFVWGFSSQSRIFKLICRRRKKIFKDLMHFHYMAILASSYGFNPLPKDHEFHNLDRGFHDHQKHAFRFTDTCMVVEKI